MGYCISHPEESFGIEVRSESLIISQDYSYEDNQFHYNTDDGRSRIFAYGEELGPKHGGAAEGIELHKALVEKLLAFFDNPANRKLCGLNVPLPLETGL